jgi:hypothetical protein
MWNRVIIYRNILLIAYLLLVVAMLSQSVLDVPTNFDYCAEFHNPPSGPYTPPLGKALLIVGQDLGAIGGLKNYEDGYADQIGIIPSGLTTYTNLIDLEGGGKLFYY